MVICCDKVGLGSLGVVVAVEMGLVEVVVVGLGLVGIVVVRLGVVEVVGID